MGGRRKRGFTHYDDQGNTENDLVLRARLARLPQIVLGSKRGPLGPIFKTTPCAPRSATKNVNAKRNSQKCVRGIGSHIYGAKYALLKNSAPINAPNVFGKLNKGMSCLKYQI